MARIVNYCMALAGAPNKTQQRDRLGQWQAVEDDIALL